MIQKKICMLGAFAVGKTSLVSRFVRSLFSEKYLTTVGVKIDKKLMTVDGQDINLILWDLAGEDDFQRIRTSYLRGASGYFLIVDGTRPSTLDTAIGIKETADQAIGDVPFIVLLNKADLIDDWELTREQTDDLYSRDWTVITSSAKTGEGVEEAFTELTRQMIEV
jgi:small GTP-binding protein